MKTKILQTTILLTLVLATNACAQQVTWLDGGNKIHATLQDTNRTVEIKEKQTSNKSIKKDKPFEIILSTKQKAIIIGGVYVKTTEVQTVLDWASNNGYEAKEHKIIEGAIKVKTTPSQAIEVANKIAKLKGVTTASPTLGRRMHKR